MTILKGVSAMSATALKFIDPVGQITPLNVPIAEGDRLIDCLNKLQGQISALTSTGASILFKDGVPTTEGSDGDYAVDVNTSIFYKKVSGSWVSQLNNALSIGPDIPDFEVGQKGLVIQELDDDFIEILVEDGT